MIHKVKSYHTNYFSLTNWKFGFFYFLLYTDVLRWLSEADTRTKSEDDLKKENEEEMKEKKMANIKEREDHGIVDEKPQECTA
jgi:hypothetical protein